MTSTRAAVVVVCGGRARRFGSDKTRADLAGRPVLDHVLDSLPTDWPTICVGERRHTSRPVGWTREEPPLGGPAAALAAGLSLVELPVVAVVGGDMPYAGAALPALVAELARHGGVDAAVARDGDGRLQPLLAAYRVEALRVALGEDPADLPLMRVLDRLRLVPATVAAETTLDVDSPADLEELRRRLEP